MLPPPTSAWLPAASRVWLPAASRVWLPAASRVWLPALAGRISASAGRISVALVVLLVVLGSGDAVRAQDDDWRARMPRFPCRLVVKPPLLGVIEDGWERSPTLRRQCDDLAQARAVVSLEWDKPNSQWHARTRMGTHDGVVVAYVAVPPVDEAVGYVAHELQHVLERIRGLDFKAESMRPESGVWRAASGDFETQAAIDAGRQVWKEVSGSAREK
jgi:hypothetical protein